LGCDGIIADKRGTKTPWPWILVIGTSSNHAGRAGLESLEPDWRRLYAQTPQRTSFLAHEAALARVEHLPSADEIRCLAFADERQVRAICLLEPTRRRILRRRQKIWQVLQHDHSRQANALCPDDESARRLVPALVAHLRREREGRHILALGPMPTSSMVWEGLRSIPRAGCYVDLRESVWLLDCVRPFDELRAVAAETFSPQPQHGSEQAGGASGRSLRERD
jgi:hypothetical protein